MNDRTPPNDEDAERAAIGLCLSVGRIPEPLANLRGADFYRPAHEVIWNTLGWLLKQGRPCDGNAVLARLMETKRRAEVEMLPGLVGEGFAADPGNLALIIADRSGRRHIIDETTRTLQDAYDSADPYEEILQRAERRLARVPASESGNVDSLVTLDEFLGEAAPLPEWIIPDLLAKGERLIITGTEGGGKSTLTRQLALCAAAGMQPFTGREAPPMTVLLVDVENPKYIMQTRLSELRRAINRHGRIIAHNRLWIDRRPEGLNLGDPGDRRWLQKRVRVVNPDLIVIGPAYKLHEGGDDTKDETIARTVTGVLDELRGSAALIVEHHAPNESGGTVRPVRPFGSSLWRRWPEFGYGIRPMRPYRGLSAEEIDRRWLVDVVAWRGARDERSWPRQMESGGTGLPWIETVVEAA